MRRRDVLGVMAGLTLLPLGRGARAAFGAGDRRLVVVLLRGAVDGLNVVVPHGDDAYAAARPTIAIGKPGTGDAGALDLDGYFGLHPVLAGLLPLWREKQLAFVHAAGSPEPTRSHFDAQLYVETGIPGRRNAGDGWMNRLLGTMPGVGSPTAALAVGPIVPQILRGRHPVANLPLGPAVNGKTPLDRPEIAAAFDRIYAGGDPLARSYWTGRAAHAELVANLPEEQQAANAGAPPPTALPAQAERLAGLIRRDRNIRLAFVSLGGWDTHVRQGADKGRLAGLLQPLGDALAALAQGLASDWRDTVVVVLSEFGRTVRENGDGGTDHGHGNAIWVLGGPVRGGRIYGDWPGLAPAGLYQGRDLAVTTDYRTVLAAILARHLRVPDRGLADIFPDFAPPHSEVERIVA